MTFRFTRHAAERYIQFHMLDSPTASVDEAAAILNANADGGRRTHRSHRGDQVWSIDALGIEVVAKHEDGVDVVVTVLPPPRFRGLTPLQAERVADSLTIVEAELAQIAEERAVVPKGKPQPPKGQSLVEKREAAERHAQVTLLKKRYQGALIERDILCSTLKTMRHQISREDDRALLKSAMRIAVRSLSRIRDSDAVDALEEIATLSPGLVTEEFLNGDNRDED